MVDAGGASVPEGTVLEERYRLDRRIGAGGFANVYAGTHLLLGVPVAVKMLRLPRDVTGEQRRRLVDAFAAEARLLTRLRDERIVRTLDQGLYAGPEMEGPTPYLVLEWCGEETLKDVLARRTGRAVPLSAALWVADAVAGAAAAAHALGVAHRDLKPSNVMLPEGPEGKPEPRVIDFGIAKVFDEAETAGSGETATRSIDTPFTPAYAAPEQIARTRTGPWTDVHAIGLLFVELVSGRPPYSSQSAGLGAVDPARPTPAAHGIDVGPIEPVISRALSLRPADRYRDASELREALRRAALSASHPIPASFPGWDPGPLELAETISSPPQMTQPISHTIPADASRRTEGDARRAVGRRVGIALSASGAAAAAAGAIGLWWSGRGSTAQESAAGSTEPLGARGADRPRRRAPPARPSRSAPRHLRLRRRWPRRRASCPRGRTGTCASARSRSSPR